MIDFLLAAGIGLLILLCVIGVIWIFAMINHLFGIEAALFVGLWAILTGLVLAALKC